MAVDFEFKDTYTIEDLVKIVALLRAPDGCPWDRAQTHESIKKNFIEETYEVIEAIHKKDASMLKEELGDVLLQVLLHAQMEAEAGRFTFADVADAIAAKLVFRHPHVFGSRTAADEAQALESWNDAKAVEKQYHSAADRLNAVPKELPALMRAQKVQSRASKCGFDWPPGALSEVLSKVSEECAGLQAAAGANDAAAVQEELGDLLFSVVNAARFAGQDAEEALGAATEKFVRRITLCEELASAAGIDPKTMRQDEFDRLWQQAKQKIEN